MQVNTYLDTDFTWHLSGVEMIGVSNSGVHSFECEHGCVCVFVHISADPRISITC